GYYSQLRLQEISGPSQNAEGNSGVGRGDADLGRLSAARQVHDFLLDGRLAGAEAVDLALSQDAAARVEAQQSWPHLLIEHCLHFRGHTGHGYQVGLADLHPDAWSSPVGIGDRLGAEGK